MKALALILAAPVLVPVAVLGGFVGVARLALREWRKQQLAKAIAEQHIADLDAEIARHRVKLAEGVRSRRWN